MMTLSPADRTATSDRTKGAINADGVTWIEADPGFWVGSREGDFLGTIERATGRYLVRNSRGELIGERATLAESRSMLAFDH